MKPTESFAEVGVAKDSVRPEAASAPEGVLALPNPVPQEVVAPLGPERQKVPAPSGRALISGPPAGSAGDEPWVQARMKALWAEADWASLARRLDPGARHLVSAAGIKPGDRVLDVAAGNGNVAIWAARAGADVTASDLSPEMVRQGVARCAGEGLAVEWHEADMEHLPFRDGRFDAVLSAFGFPFAFCGPTAVKEAFRVARPGGTVAAANWGQSGFAAELMAKMSEYFSLAGGGDGKAAGEDGAGQVIDWSSHAEICRHLKPFASAVRILGGRICDDYESAQKWWEEAASGLPAIIAAGRVLPPDLYKAFADDLIAAAGRGQPAGKKAGFRVTADYLIVVADNKSAA